MTNKCLGLIAIFICVWLIIVARQHPPTNRRVKEIWHGRIFWKRELNTTMLRTPLKQTHENKDELQSPSLPKHPSDAGRPPIPKPTLKVISDICRPHVVFTSFKCPHCDKLRNRIEYNTFTTWSNLKDVNFIDIKNTKTNMYNVPILGDMYKFVFNKCPNAKTYTYINGDILGKQDFIETLNVVQPIGDFLMIGKRTNVEWSDNIDSSHPDFDFDVHFKNGALFRSDAQDYFTVTKNAINWDNIPPFVIGRPGYDNWLVDHIYHNNNVALIDGTKTVSIIHQTGNDGNFAHGGKKVKSSSDKEYNRRIGKGQWDHGETHHAEWETGRVDGKIVLKNRKTNKLYASHTEKSCSEIQSEIKLNSWNVLSKEKKTEWSSMNCESSLKIKMPSKQPTKLNKCLLVANGPSLNKQTWGFIDEMDYVLGMNKIYLGLNKYSLPLNAYVVVNPLVAEQSVDPILHKLSLNTEKFVAINRKNKFPTGTDIRFFKSGGPVFSNTLDILYEGWTVTYVGLQILYIKGCQTVYIVGMDHHFEQQGTPNSMQTMKGDDPNHFDSSYFKGNQWHLADLKQNEKHYKIARDEYEKDGRQIIDATIDGHCTVFEKIKSMKDAKTPPITQKCKNVVEWKKSHGWDVCRDVISDNCVIYAMGIGRFSQWDQMMSEPPYNCEVHSFDPTPTGKKHVQSLKNPGFIYHEMGVGLIDGYQDVFVPTAGDKFTKTSTTPRNGRKPTTISIPVKKIKTIMRELGHASLDMLKIDIEGGEIEILRDLFSSPVDIKSVCAEFHSESPLPLNEIDQLLKNAGYVPYIPWKSVRAYLGVHLGERCWFKPLEHNTSPIPCIELVANAVRGKSAIIKTLNSCLKGKDVYSILQYEQRGLCIDVGGHVGWTAVKMAEHGHRVISIEPFEGNYGQFYSETAAFEDITLVKGGASDKSGKKCLGGASTVSQTKNNIGEFDKQIQKGTSSVGTLKSNSNCANPVQVYTVEKISKDQDILFLKIDVQGSELNVLKGAKKQIQEGRVKWIYFEFLKSQSISLISWVIERGYSCFDTEYQFRTANAVNFEGHLIKPVNQLALTNGLHWMEGLVDFGPSELTQWKAYLNKLPHFSQTDILCVFTGKVETKKNTH
jgi:FkbM family methyltransferase